MKKVLNNIWLNAVNEECVFSLLEANLQWICITKINYRVLSSDYLMNIVTSGSYNQWLSYFGQSQGTINWDSEYFPGCSKFFTWSVSLIVPKTIIDHKVVSSFTYQLATDKNFVHYPTGTMQLYYIYGWRKVCQLFEHSKDFTITEIEI